MDNFNECHLNCGNHLESDLDFALFYEDRKLLYVVPYTKDDHHYVDQILDSHAILGSKISVDWVKLDLQGVESYVSDPKLGRDIDYQKSNYFDWSIQNIINHILHGYIFYLSNQPVNLLVPKFEKYTGLNSGNIKDFRLKTLKEWLNSYDVDYQEKLLHRGYERSGCYPEEDKGKISLFGSFSIDATPRNEELIDFLQNYDVIFKPTIKKSGERRYKLLSEAPWDGQEDPISVMNHDILHDYPHIPMMATPETEYTSLKQQINPILTAAPTEVSLAEAMKGNQRVIDKFEVDYHPELVLLVTNESKKEVSLTRYNGYDSEYEVPNKVHLDENGSDIYTIVTIGEFAFHNSNVCRITLPDTIRELEQGSFIYCKNLENIVLSKNLQYIRTLAFRGCTNLRSITLPSSIIQVEKHSLWLLKEIYYSCPADAIAEQACNRDICKLIDDTAYIEPKPTPENTSNSGVEAFIALLSDNEKEYLKLVIDRKDTKTFLKSIGKTESVVCRGINSKMIETLDDDEGLFPEPGTIVIDEEGNLDFDINYNVCLRDLL